MSLETRLVELVEVLGRDYAAVMLQTRDEKDSMVSAARSADFYSTYTNGKADEPV